MIKNLQASSLSEANILYGPDIRADRRVGGYGLQLRRHNGPRPPVMKAEPKVVKYPYRCGFQPRGKHLAEVVAHWRQCEHWECREMLANHMELKDYFREKFGHRALPRSYDMESRMIPETNESTQR